MNENMYLYLLEQFIVGFLVQGISSHLFIKSPVTNGVQSETPSLSMLTYDTHDLNHAHENHLNKDMSGVLKEIPQFTV